MTEWKPIRWFDPCVLNFTRPNDPPKMEHSGVELRNKGGKGDKALFQIRIDEHFEKPFMFEDGTLEVTKEYAEELLVMLDLALGGDPE